MTSYQRARRLVIWRGSFSMIFACTFFMLASALAGSITSWSHIRRTADPIGDNRTPPGA